MQKIDRSLYLCNTVYQVLVAMWLKHFHFPDCNADIILSDHMNNGKDLCDQLQRFGEFDNCYYVESLEFTKIRHHMDSNLNRQIRLWPQRVLPKYIDLTEKYSKLYFANVDVFSDFFYSALVHKNPELKLYLFEDGLSTYTKLFEGFYNEKKLIKLDPFHTIIRKVFGETGLYGNVESLYLFNPQNIRWNPPFSLQKINTIDRTDTTFVEICNRVFQYNDSIDVYAQKYIFMEESFAADGTYINDVDLLEQLAFRVGKENVIVKIHPRNPVNRFAEKGFKTNVNTSIPWEVILLNLNDVSDKVFLTVASSSVLNPILLFGMDIKAYSLYNLVNREIREESFLRGDFWEAVYSIMCSYPENIKMCNSIDEII